MRLFIISKSPYPNSYYVQDGPNEKKREFFYDPQQILSYFRKDELFALRKRHIEILMDDWLENEALLFLKKGIEQLGYTKVQFNYQKNRETTKSSQTIKPLSEVIDTISRIQDFDERQRTARNNQTDNTQ